MGDVARSRRATGSCSPIGRRCASSAAERSTRKSHPLACTQRLAPRWPALRERASALASAALAGGSSEGDDAALVRRSAELDAMTLLLTEEVSDGTTDLSAVYLPGLDIAQHALLGDAAGLPSASAMSSRLQSLEAYYVALDRLLASVVRPGSGEVVVLITAPGRVAPGATGRFDNPGISCKGGERNRRASHGRRTDDPLRAGCADEPGTGWKAPGRSLRRAVRRALYGAVRGDVRTSSESRTSGNRAAAGPGNDRSPAKPRIRSLDSRRSGVVSLQSRSAVTVGSRGSSVAYFGARISSELSLATD